MKRLTLGLIVLLLIAVALSVAAGKVWVPLDAWTADDPRSIIIVELRLPRTVLALLVGAALGLSGAVMQGYLRNPLADPGLFGVSSGAAFGAVLALYFGYAAQMWLLPGFALVGAGVTMTLLALIAGRSGSLILFTLGGMILTSITGSLTSLAISLAPTPFVSSSIVTWLLGALTDRSWDDVVVAAPLIALGMGVLAMTARSLDALTLGEAAARSMGVDPARLQRLVILGVALTVGASVASAGIIGFVGLIVPHLVRPLAGNRPSAILLPSALAGAVLLTFADSLVRLAPTVSELRLGIAMSMLGGPFFLYLLIAMRRRLA
ncbi:MULTISPECIES: FecCD family ABC transporter permease [Sphingomonas]|jgi:iron complex transport system permease protein|uniref:ABC transporter permease n=1 Tax=Sphingomonas hankookensis TaxID=563996 RepID=A0ABR5YAI9_9SPHN|nr:MULTISPECIES: iron ABC transporter permease [Sphingomonas]KZE11494.1 ABC transporter permease [Sphingomonas hankookensis]PZT94122.1 MAG: iron ABC transporter permease [Sphingomonas sp.]RSV30866.1 iron ABC transporter permease [Sphingomonas sp. ABOLH]WCP72224.1 iron ABC transporter permease [Sphingomonas hankookensis]